jgi:hypothetical protein
MQANNNFIAHLNLGDRGILKDPYDIEKTHITEDLANIWRLHPQFVNQDIVNKIEESGLFIIALYVLKTSTTNTRWDIHADVGNWEVQDDSARLNWVYGNNQSPMIFFRPKDPSKQNIKEMALYSTYVEDPFLKKLYEEGRTCSRFLYYEPEDVVEVHRELVGFPSIVQVGVPHNVELQGDETRYCVAAIIGDKSDPYQPTTFLNAANKLSKYLINN